MQLTSAALLPKKAVKGRRRVSAAALEGPDDKSAGVDKLEWMVGQLLNMLHSPTPATICGGARALRVIAEARAHAAHAAGDAYEEEPFVTDLFVVRFQTFQSTLNLVGCWWS